MVDKEEYSCKRQCQSMEMSMCVKSEEVANGIANKVRSDVAEGSSGESLRTYKRRKRAKMSSESKMQEEGGVSRQVFNDTELHQSIQDQLMINVKNHPCEQAGFDITNCHSTINGSHDCSPTYWRNVVLKSIYKSLKESKGGIQGCIRDALEYQGGNDYTTTFKEDIKKDIQCLSHTSLIANGSQIGTKEHLGIASIESARMEHQTGTELCQHSFFNILVSEKFAALCKLLNESFQGIKVESFFDYNLIDRRMKEGAYECSPTLFRSDILQIFGKIQRIGSELVSLARSLSNVSSTSNCEQFCSWGCDGHSKLEQPEPRAVNKVCSCVRCGEKADDRECLVCDYCEELYHVSCIEPTVKDISSRNWCCPKCSSSGIELPHEHCVVCERLNAPRTLRDKDRHVTSTNEEETVVELEESSNCVTGDGYDILDESENPRCCKICTAEIVNHEKYQTCGHPFCSSKYYHVKCLTKRQLKLHAPCWYCPSCLCRVCLKNRDDEKIVLCDACDHGYHIYCMKPPRDTVPRGKWFCRKCKAGIRRIRQAKRAYGILSKKPSREDKAGNRDHEDLERKPKENCEDIEDKAEGVDMLLTAANTLNFEEKLVARQSYID